MDRLGTDLKSIIFDEVVEMRRADRFLSLTRKSYVCGPLFHYASKTFDMRTISSSLRKHMDVMTEKIKKDRRMKLSVLSIQNYSMGDSMNSMMTCFEFAVFYRSKRTARTQKQSMTFHYDHEKEAVRVEFQEKYPGIPGIETEYYSDVLPRLILEFLITLYSTTISGSEQNVEYTKLKYKVQEHIPEFQTTDKMIRMILENTKKKRDDFWNLKGERDMSFPDHVEKEDRAFLKALTSFRMLFQVDFVKDVPNFEKSEFYE